MLYSGQGKVYIATASSGVPGAFRFIGNVSELDIALKTEIMEHKESTSGGRLTDARVPKGKSAELTAKISEFNAANLALTLYGTKTTQTGGSIANEQICSTLPAVGDFLRLKNIKVSAVVITDSTGSPKTLTAGTNYRVNTEHGTIEILDVTTGGAFVAPLKAAYTAPATNTQVAMLNAAQPEFWLRFEGLNTADSNKAVLVEMYRFTPDPAKQFGLISDDFATFELAGSVLYDANQTADATYGQFGRVVMPA